VLQYLALLFVAGMVVVGLVVHRALRVRAVPAALDVTVDAAAAVAEA